MPELHVRGIDLGGGDDGDAKLEHCVVFAGGLCSDGHMGAQEGKSIPPRVWRGIPQQAMGDVTGDLVTESGWFHKFHFFFFVPSTTLKLKIE